jgi:hypothetical protein
MSEDKEEKPIRGLLRNITSANEASGMSPRGFIAPKLVNRITFFASLVSLLLIVAAFLSMIWDFTDPMLALRCIGSIIVILIALFIFRAINAQFD